jgi:opacity protein-like surface antigen
MRKSLLSILIAVPAALMPLAAAGQVVPASETAPVERAAPSYKYEAYVGYGYTSLNQVNLSRNGLQGVDFAVTRDWGKYFGLTAQGGYFKYAYDTTNPGDPSVVMVLAGPELHAPLFTKASAFVHVVLGGQHTGGEGINPDIAFAWGSGLGVEYQLKPRIYLRILGDSISSSSVQDPEKLGYSTHPHRNAHATIGVAYKF